MDQNSDVEIEFYEEITGNLGYNSPLAQAPNQMLTVSCPSDRTTFQGPKSNKDRELFAHDLWSALGSYDELAEVSQVPQDAIATTPVMHQNRANLLKLFDRLKCYLAGTMTHCVRWGP